jgi:hypothetical protein
MIRAGAGIFEKLEPEPELEPVKNGPAPQHWFLSYLRVTTNTARASRKTDLLNLFSDRSV